MGEVNQNSGCGCIPLKCTSKKRVRRLFLCAPSLVRLREFFLPCQRTATETLSILPWLLTLAFGLARACFWMCNSQPPKTQRCQVNVTVFKKKNLIVFPGSIKSTAKKTSSAGRNSACLVATFFFSHVKSCRSRNVARHTSGQGRGQDSSAIAARQQRQHESGLALCVMDLE